MALDGADLISKERDRRKTVEHYSIEDDMGYDNYDLALAAIAYIASASIEANIPAVS